MTRLWAGTALGTVAALVAVTAWLGWGRGAGDPFAKCRTTSVGIGEAAIGGPFTLVDQTGTTVTDQTVVAKPALVYFGYTFCPDICPVDVARNVEAVDILEERGVDVTPVFISIDPDRDTPEVLADFANALHPDLVALTGTPEQVRAAAQVYKAYFKPQNSGDDFYLVDHSVFTYLMLPETGFAELYRREATPDEMAESVACFAG